MSWQVQQRKELVAPFAFYFAVWALLALVLVQLHLGQVFEIATFILTFNLKSNLVEDLIIHVDGHHWSVQESHATWTVAGKT